MAMRQERTAAKNMTSEYLDYFKNGSWLNGNATEHTTAKNMTSEHFECFMVACFAEKRQAKIRMHDVGIRVLFTYFYMIFRRCLEESVLSSDPLEAGDLRVTDGRRSSRYLRMHILGYYIVHLPNTRDHRQFHPRTVTTQDVRKNSHHLRCCMGCSSKASL